MVAGEKSTEELRRHLQTVKMASAKSRTESIGATLSPDVLQLVNQSRDKSASSWLTAAPLIDQGVVLNTQEFRDSLRLRYNLPLSDLPSQCVCGEKFTVGRALSCKKMEFLAFEWIRMSPKWNISAALKQWRLELVQLKCIMGFQGGVYKRFVAREIVILDRHLVWSLIYMYIYF